MHCCYVFLAPGLTNTPKPVSNRVALFMLINHGLKDVGLLNSIRILILASSAASLDASNGCHSSYRIHIIPADRLCTILEQLSTVLANALSLHFLHTFVGCICAPYVVLPVFPNADLLLCVPACECNVPEINGWIFKVVCVQG